jgi:hypothetical protein
MKKVFILVLAASMLILAFAGCDKAPAADSQESADVSQTAPDDTSAPADETADVSNVPVSGTGTPAEAYTAFLAAKSTVITKLRDGLTSTEQTASAAITIQISSRADLMMLPVSFFGAGEEAAAMGLEMLNASDVQYSENGNSYTFAYSDEKGVAYTFNGTYDPTADVLVCTAQEDGKDSFYSEYRKTSYGYVSQYFFINDDSTTSLYQFAISGQDGVFGISTTQASQPAALTGSEAADFPKSLPEWYSILGSAITGVMPDGTQVNFEYVTTATE